jgi:hypothetical protein
MVAMGLTYLSTLFGPDGTPEKHDGRYYENDKGELTEISHDEYRRGQAWDQRRMSSIPAAFYALGTAAAFAAPKFLDRRPPPPIDRRPPASVTRNPHLDSPADTPGSYSSSSAGGSTPRWARIAVTARRSQDSSR